MNSPLCHVDSLVQWACHVSGINHGAADPREVQSVAIVGAGIMGTAIAAASIEHGLPVVLIDHDDEARAAAPEKVFEQLAGEQLPVVGCQLSVAGGKPTPATRHPPPTTRYLLRCVADPAEIAGCDLVLESVTETASVKHGVYAELEPHLAATATLASNTSAIPIARLAAGLSLRHRFCGLHFFHPVRSRPLVEVVRGPETSDETIATAVAYAKWIGKRPIVVRDGPGFLVNRLLVPYLAGAMELLLDGASLDQIDGAATDFGMAMGPLHLLDEIGLDTALLAGRILWNAFPERITVSPLLISMYKTGRLGRKCGKGFFLYPNGNGCNGPRRPDPEFADILAAWARLPQSFSREDIVARLLLPMILEATRLLDEGTVRDPRSIDLGTIYGLGFPASRGGLLYWADTLGSERILAMLQRLARLDPRMKPTPMLLEMARHGGRFYEHVLAQAES